MIISQLVLLLAPTAAAADVVSIYSDSYTNEVVSEWNPDWGQSTTLETVTVGSDNFLKVFKLKLFRSCNKL